MDASGSARLASAIPAERAVATTMPRAEIVTAASGEAPELLLELERDGERDRVSIAWQQRELEELLDLATADEVLLTFDREELAEALADVEAHGLRKQAAVFSIAATAIAGAAGSAAAMPITDAGLGPVRGPSVAPAATDASSSGGYGVSGGSSGGPTIPTPSPVEGGIAGALALTIAGAAFARRRQSAAGRPA